MTDFSTGKKVCSFADGLNDAFPFFRAFLEDADDAEITYFLSTREADIKSLKRIESAIAKALKKVVSTYPSMMPPQIEIVRGYENEAVLAQGVARIVQMLVHLQGCVSAFIRVMELGGDTAKL